MVECRAKTQAISAVVGDRFEATPLTTKEAIAWSSKGAQYLDLSEQPEDGADAE